MIPEISITIKIKHCFIFLHLLLSSFIVFRERPQWPVWFFQKYDKDAIQKIWKKNYSTAKLIYQEFIKSKNLYYIRYYTLGVLQYITIIDI